MLQRIILAFSLILIIEIDLIAQIDTSQGSFRFVSIKLHSGKHFYTGHVLTDKLKNGYGSIEVRAGWQSKGEHEWEKQFNYPSYGIGWYSGYVGDVDIFGNPNALFGFITFPVLRRPQNDLQIEPAFGLTYHLKPYNPTQNKLNDAIGAKFAVYFSLHMGGRYKLNREIDLLYGGDMTHFSNGRTYTPNTGLNMMGFSSGVCYHFNAGQKKVDRSLYPSTILHVRPVLPKKERPVKMREDNISLYQAIGTVQNKVDAGTNTRYYTSSTVIEYQHKFNTMHGVTIGFDGFHDPSARDTTEFPLNKEKRQSFFPAAHIGYDFMFWRITVKFQYGINFTKVGRDIKGGSFIRPALRYEFSKKLFGQIGLKTFNGATADWVELGLGYKFFYSHRRMN